MTKGTFGSLLRQLKKVEQIEFNMYSTFLSASLSFCFWKFKSCVDEISNTGQILFYIEKAVSKN